MQRYLLFSCFLFLSFASWSQKFTLNGYVRDAENGEELLGVTIYVPQLKAGTVTNDYGFYALTLPKGTYEVQYTYVGFDTKTITVDLSQDVSQNIEMASEASLIQEVVIEEKAIDENVISVQMSKNTLNMAQV